MYGIIGRKVSYFRKNKNISFYEYFFIDWPQDNRPEKHETLRLIYQGRFLHGNVTLGALKLPIKQQTVMHLVHREKLPQANPEEKQKEPKSEPVNNNARMCPGFLNFLRRCLCCPPG